MQLHVDEHTPCNKSTCITDIVLEYLAYKKTGKVKRGFTEFTLSETPPPSCKRPIRARDVASYGFLSRSRMDSIQSKNPALSGCISQRIPHRSQCNTILVISTRRTSNLRLSTLSLKNIIHIKAIRLNKHQPDCLLHIINKIVYCGYRQIRKSRSNKRCQNNNTNSSKRRLVIYRTKQISHIVAYRQRAYPSPQEEICNHIG